MIPDVNATVEMLLRWIHSLAGITWIGLLYFFNLVNVPLMKALDYGKGYRYAHDHEGHYVEQQHLPDRLAGRRYYHPGDLGYEKQIKEWWENLRERP